MTPYLIPSTIKNANVQAGIAIQMALKIIDNPQGSSKSNSWPWTGYPRSHTMCLKSIA